MKGEQRPEVKKISAGGVEITDVKETPGCVGGAVFVDGKETHYNYCQEPEGGCCKHRARTSIPPYGSLVVCVLRKTSQPAPSKEQ